MDFAYNLLTYIAWQIVKAGALVNAKLKLFVDGRKNTHQQLATAFTEKNDVIWMHAASLGEFEQGLPIIENLKRQFPSYKILITFFSPSGYEVKKNTPIADLVTYLPFDTLKNAQQFIATVNPKLAIFVKYEIWPNYLKVLSQKQIPTILVSAIFNEKQIYFKSYGAFLKKKLKCFTQIFVQDKNSAELLATININHTTISGDTRLDRVSEILNRDNTLAFMHQFKKDQQCFVAGSTWPEDEAILINFINATTYNLKFVIAPHTIKPEKILNLQSSISKKTLLFSKLNEQTVSDFDVLIIDHIGLLTKIYSYADFAYVGGAFSTGLHNILEPAVFGIPVLIGPNYKGFKEAEDLVKKNGVFPIKDLKSFNELFDKFIKQPHFLNKTGEVNASYISKNKGASIQITTYLSTWL